MLLIFSKYSITLIGMSTNVSVDTFEETMENDLKCIEEGEKMKQNLTENLELQKQELAKKMVQLLDMKKKHDDGVISEKALTPEFYNKWSDYMVNAITIYDADIDKMVDFVLKHCQSFPTDEVDPKQLSVDFRIMDDLKDIVNRK